MRKKTVRPLRRATIDDVANLAKTSIKTVSRVVNNEPNVSTANGKQWFEQNFLPKFHPVMIGALLLTLVLIFAFQAENLTTRWIAVLLIAVPIIIQVYFNSGLAYFLMRLLRVEHSVASPGALIGASNFFELAVAVAITLFGANSGAALATVVGVLIEVPVMLLVVKVVNVSRGWY